VLLLRQVSELGGGIEVLLNCRPLQQLFQQRQDPFEPNFALVFLRALLLGCCSCAGFAAWFGPTRECLWLRALPLLLLAAVGAAGAGAAQSK
jgi:hypothetical protein